jgi:Fic family protein
MSLTYSKLIKFDLVDDAEAKLDKKEYRDKFMEFFKICGDIIDTDEFIRDCPSFPYSTKNIVRDELMSAIGSTLAIEGITLREDEIKETLQQTRLQDNLKRKQQEVLNSQNVYDYIQNEVNNCEGKFIYKLEHVNQIHKLFTEKIEYIGNRPGQYRNCTALFGEPRKKSLCETYADIYTAMKGFIDWLNRETTELLNGSVIVKAIMSHYYLTEIHPFGDGNGRTARAVEAMVFYANKINPYCFWSLANFWSTHRNDYIVHLGNVRDTCGPMEFLMWGAKGYLEEVKRIKGRVLKKVRQLMLRDYVRYLVDEKTQQKPEERINQRIRRIVELLTRSEKIALDKFRSYPEYKSLYSGMATITQGRDLDKMKSLKLILVTTVEGKEFIEPNYSLLDSLRYRV